MAGRHSIDNPDAPTADAPEQWVPPIVVGPPPSGDGPQQYEEVVSTGAGEPELLNQPAPTAPAEPEERDPAA